MRSAVALATLAVYACIAAAAASGGSVQGKLCGASGCHVLPRALAMTLSQRTDVFSSAGAPRPAPYYRIVIKAAAAEHISRTILWVPSKKLWFDAEDVTPPLPGFWRTAGTAKDFPGLAALAGKVTPYPAPKRWVLPHY